MQKCRNNTLLTEISLSGKVQNVDPVEFKIQTVAQESLDRICCLYIGRLPLRLQ